VVKATKKWWPVFVLPTVAAFMIGFVIPFLEGLYLSFCKFTTINKASWVGFSNYVKVFQDAQFWDSLTFTASFTVVSTVLINVLAFAIALALTRGLRGTNLFRTVFFHDSALLFCILLYLFAILHHQVSQRYIPGQRNRCYGQHVRRCHLYLPHIGYAGSGRGHENDV
jgi:raffinose/stachyose/melibiose transport system permease protein